MPNPCAMHGCHGTLRLLRLDRYTERQGGALR